MSQPRVQIIDYGLGNLFSIKQACCEAGLDAVVSASPDEIAKSDAIILPGVGAFQGAMDCLKELQFIEPIHAAIASSKPLLGICLGMQLLFDESEEFGVHAGLGVFPGRIRRIPDQVDDSGRRLRVPNVGWNRVQHAGMSDAAGADPGILAGISDNAFMYFVHSYFADPASSDDWLLSTRYGGFRYCCAAQRGNTLGLQFHPEKSGPAGLRFYQNWAQTL